MKKVLALAFIALALTVATAMGAAAGKLDPSFGEGGRAVRAAGFGATAYGLGKKAAQSPDGHVYVLANDRTVLAFQANGQVEAGFGAGGAIEPFSADVVLGPAEITVDRQGRVLVATTILPPEKPPEPLAEHEPEPVPEPRQEILVARYTPAGQPDPSFGSNGRAVTDLGLPPPQVPSSFGPGKPRGARVSVSGIAVDAGGRIVLSGKHLAAYEICNDPGGHRPVRVAFLARLGDDGRPDPSFGQGGVATLREGPVGPPVPDESGGAYVSVGTPLPCAVGARRATGYLFHLDASGAPLAGFGRGGWRFIPEDPYVRMVPDGRGGLVLMPVSAEWTRRLIVRRLRSDGTWDRRFGRKGVAEPFPFPQGSLSFADLGIGPGGHIYVTGSWTRKARPGVAKHRFLLFRLDRRGELDRDYGILRTGFGRGTTAFARFLLIAAGGKPLVIGLLASPSLPGGAGVALARYLPGR